MDYSQLESFLSTSMPTPQFNKPPFKLEVSQVESGAYIISLLNSAQELGMQVKNDDGAGYDHAVRIFENMVSRWNGLAVLSKLDLSSAQESRLIEHALREFKAVGYAPFETLEEGPDKWMQQNVLQLLHVFSGQGHSGSSAPYAISAFEKLASFQPLSPLTGEDWEWHEPSPGLFQNLRCSHVFMDASTGEAYDDQAVFFREPNGSCYQSADSRRAITFPYTPKVEYVDVPALETQE